MLLLKWCGSPTARNEFLSNGSDFLIQWGKSQLAVYPNSVITKEATYKESVKPLNIEKFCKNVSSLNWYFLNVMFDCQITVFLCHLFLSALFLNYCESKNTYTHKNGKHRSTEWGSACLQKLLDLLTANNL